MKQVYYIEGIHKVFRYMTHSSTEETWIRVSVVTCNENCADAAARQLEFEWSHSDDNIAGSDPHDLGAGDLDFYDEYIPLMATGTRLILVETSRTYEPPFNALTSFGEKKLVSHVVTRPRFAANFCWETCSSGSGIDGDDGDGSSGS